MKSIQQTGSNFYVVGGTLPPEALSYIQRKADTDLLDGLRSGDFCYVLNTRQVGKSSLMIRTAMKLRSLGYSVAVLDITETGQNLTTEQFYFGLLLRVAEQLNMDDELIDYWRENKEIGPFQRWMTAITEIALPLITSSLIIFIDEIDAVRSLPFPTDELFAGIRECYNRRVSSPDLLRLSFCLLGVAVPEDLIQDVRTTPFNIGKRIELQDFTAEEAMQLAEVIGIKPLKQIMYWTGGHPYLTQRLCAAVAAKDINGKFKEVDAICNAMFLSHKAREADDNLAFVRNRIVRSDTDIAGLLDLYSKVRNDWKRFRNDESYPQLSTLLLAGLARTSGDCIVVRNRIYRHVFDNNWIKQNMPDAELRRLHSAYLRGLVRAAVIAAGVLSIIVSLYMGNYRLLEENKLALFKAETAQQRSKVSERKARDESNAKQAALEIAQAEKLKALTAEKRKSLALTRERAAVHEVWRVAELERRQKVRAMSAESSAKRSRLTATKQFYITDIFAANREYETNNITQATNRLTRWSKQQASSDFRHFEWGYLWKVCHSSLRDIKLDSYSINQLQLSPDNQMIATAQTNGDVVIRDSGSCAILKTLQGHKQEVRSLAFNSDGSLLVTGALDHDVNVWDPSTGTLISTINDSNGAINAVAISPDGELIAADSGKVSNKYTTTVWDRKTKNVVCFLEDVRAPVCTIAFSPDSKLLATAGAEKAIRIWDIPSGNARSTLLAHTDSISSVVFSRSGRYLASGGKDSKVIVWDTRDWKLYRELLGHTEEINQVAFANDANLLASASSDRSVRIWDWRNENTKQIIRGHNRAVNSVSISSDASLVVTASSDRTIKTWNTEEGVDGSRIIPVRSTAESVVFSPGGTLVATGTEKEIIISDSATGKQISTITTSKNGKNVTNNRTISFSENSDRILTAGGSAIACIWSLETGKWITSLDSNKGEVTCATYSPNNSMIATGNTNKKVVLWDSKTCVVIKTFNGHTGPVTDVQFSPDGKKIASASEDGNARVWNTDGSPSSIIFTHPPGTKLVKLAFSPDGNYLVTGSRNGTMRVWDMNTGKLHNTVDAFREWITSIKFSSDGSRLLASCKGTENIVRLWDWATCSELLTLRGHTDFVNDTAFSPDGTKIASAGSDNCIRIWSSTPLPNQQKKQIEHNQRVKNITYR